MAKKKKEENERGAYVFTTGVDLSDGRRFEAGAPVPDDIGWDDWDAVCELKAVEAVTEDE